MLTKHVAMDLLDARASELRDTIIILFFSNSLNTVMNRLAVLLYGN